MSRPAVVVLCLVMVATSACAHRVPRSRAPGPAAAVLSGVPLLDFGEDDCGAGSLATVLEYWEIPASMDELSAGADYFSIMRRNLVALREALGCR